MIRLAYGDIGRLPVDILFLSTRGGFDGGAASSVMKTLGEMFPTVLGDSGEKIKDLVRSAIGAKELEPGQARFVQMPKPSRSPLAIIPDLMLLRVTKTQGGATAENINRALREAFSSIPKASRKDLEVAIPVLGSGHGGLSAINAAKVMASALAAIEQQSGIDEMTITIVAWDFSDYRAFLEVFSDEGLCATSPAEHIDPSSSVNIEPLRGCALDPRSVLFIGSGFSFNVRPALPTWAELFEGLDPKVIGAISDWSQNDGLSDLAQILNDETAARDRQTPHHVHSHFCDRVSSSPGRPGVTHFQLLSLPWSAVVTTNYDDMIEKTLDALGVEYQVIASDHQLEKLVDNKGIPVLKVHGGLIQAKGSDNHDPLRLLGKNWVAMRPVATRDDYDRYFEERPALAAYFESLLMTRRGLIIGYSLSDPHFRAMFARVGRYAARPDEYSKELNPRLFFVDVSKSRLRDRYWTRRSVQPVPLMFEGKNPTPVVQAFVSALVQSAQLERCKEIVPPEKFDDARWSAITKDLEGRVLIRLIESLLSADIAPPSKAVIKSWMATLNKADAKSLRQSLRLSNDVARSVDRLIGKIEESVDKSGVNSGGGQDQTS